MDSVHNHNESAVFTTVRGMAADFPALDGDAELLADVACVALNRLAPRYIRHTVDFAFYRSDSDRAQHQKQVEDAVRYAFGFVQARTAMGARV
jgi:hypothetical protein